MISLKKPSLRGMRFIDLFAGIGGFHFALSSLGAECVFASEWDKFAQNTYHKNHGILPYGDITQIDEKQIPDHDILCAGFPCQAFSISGKQKGFEDSRGTLFFDVARIIKEKKPKVVFLENVKNFAAHDQGKTLDVVKRTMNELGYDFYTKVLNAADYGVAQKRERIYMVGFRRDVPNQSFAFPKPFKLKKSVEDYLLSDQETQSCVVQRDDFIVTYLNDAVQRKETKPIRLGIVGKGGQGERVYSPKGIAITLSAHGGGIFSKTGGYLINGKTRKLHPRECARLMGFPDSFHYDDNLGQAYKQFGNSVVINVLQYIAVQIAEVLNNPNSNKSSQA